MKRFDRRSVTALVLSSALLLGACSSDAPKATDPRSIETTETSETVATETSGTTEATTTAPAETAVAEEKTPAAAPVSDMKRFGTSIDECLYHLLGCSDVDEDSSIRGIDEIVFDEDIGKIMEQVGFVFLDINNDNKNDMIVFTQVDGTSRVLIVYCEKDTGNVISPIECNEMERLEYLESGVFRTCVDDEIDTLTCDYTMIDEKGRRKEIEKYTIIPVNPDIQGEPGYPWYKIEDDGTESYVGPELTSDFEAPVVDLTQYNPTYFRDLKRYEFVIDRITYEDAKAECEKKGGHLATIKNMREFNTVVTLMYLDDVEEYALYVGAERDENGTFVWACDERPREVPKILLSSTIDESSTNLIVYTDFLNDECALFGASNDTPFNDPESECVYGYICEYEYK